VESATQNPSGEYQKWREQRRWEFGKLAGETTHEEHRQSRWKTVNPILEKTTESAEMQEPN
jgi:hypothetical protein